MIRSRATRGFWRSVTAVAGVVIVLSPVFSDAQVILSEPVEDSGVTGIGEAVEPSDPVGLTPRFLEPDISGSIQDSAPAVDSDDSGWTSIVQPGPSPVNGGDGAIEINHLGEVTSDSVGTLTAESGGMPPVLWQGTRYDTVLTLMSYLPTGTRSPALRRMIRRLLTSEAQPPSGLVVEGEFVAKRLETLSALGESRAGSELLAIAPGRSTNNRLMRIESEVSLAEGRLVDACTQASSAAHGGFIGDYWQKLLVFCQILAGAYTEAELGVALMREVGVDDESMMLMLDSMIRGDTPVLDSLASQSPLHMAVLKASNARFGSDAVNVLSPAVLAVIAGNPDMDMATRLDAAERAAASGALSVIDHRSLLLSVPFTPEELDSPVTTAENLPGNMARALLYQAAKKQNIVSVRAEAAALAFETARADDLYASTARVFLDVIGDVPPRSDLVWFAGDAIRVFVLTGNAAAAQGWLHMLHSNALRLTEARDALIALLPVVRLAGLSGRTDAPLQFLSLTDWLQFTSGDARYRHKASFLLSMLDSLGEPVGSPTWEQLDSPRGNGLKAGDTDRNSLAGKAVLPDPALWYRLSNAASDGRIGETVLLAALALGDAGPGGAGSITVGHVVRNLSAVGLTDEAREIAIEGAIASGL